MNLCKTRVCDPLPTPAWSVRTCHAPQVDEAKVFKKEVEDRNTYNFDPVAATPNFCPATYPSVLQSALFTPARRQGKRRRLDEVSETSKKTQVYNGQSLSESVPWGGLAQDNETSSGATQSSAKEERHTNTVV